MDEDTKGLILTTCTFEDLPTINLWSLFPDEKTTAFTGYSFGQKRISGRAVQLYSLSGKKQGVLMYVSSHSIDELFV